VNIPTSDPGTGVVLTPQCKTHGLYFDDAHEPENFKYIIDKDIHENITKPSGKLYIGGSFDSMESYFDFYTNDYTDNIPGTMRLMSIDSMSADNIQYESE
jgi:hypothetical protein